VWKTSGAIYNDTAVNRCGRFEIIIEMFVAEVSGWQRFVIGFDPEQANMTTKKIRNGSRSELKPLEKKSGKAQHKTKQEILAYRSMGLS
jgi:hypothetical protein